VLVFVVSDESPRSRSAFLVGKASPLNIPILIQSRARSRVKRKAPGTESAAVGELLVAVTMREVPAVSLEKHQPERPEDCLAAEIASWRNRHASTLADTDCEKVTGCVARNISRLMQRGPCCRLRRDIAECFRSVMSPSICRAVQGSARVSG